MGYRKKNRRLMEQEIDVKGQKKNRERNICYREHGIKRKA